MTWNPDKLSQTITAPPSLLLRTHSSFLNIIYFPLSCLYYPSPSPIKMINKFPNLTAFLGITLFHSCDAPVYITLKIINVYIFSPVNLPPVSYFTHSTINPRKIEEKVFFPYSHNSILLRAQKHLFIFFLHGMMRKKNNKNKQND